jgi:hypothetical protein
MCTLGTVQFSAYLVLNVKGMLTASFFAFFHLFAPFTIFFYLILPYDNGDLNAATKKQPKTNPPETGGRVLFTSETRIAKRITTTT